MNVFIWIVFYLLCLGWLRIAVFKIYIHTCTMLTFQKWNTTSMVQQVCVLEDVCIAQAPSFLFCASCSVWHWACLRKTAQSSSRVCASGNKNQASSGPGFSWKGWTRGGCTAKDNLLHHHPLFKHLWRRGRVTSGCLQIWGLFANTLQLGTNFILHFNEF